MSFCKKHTATHTHTHSQAHVNKLRIALVCLSYDDAAPAPLTDLSPSPGKADVTDVMPSGARPNDAMVRTRKISQSVFHANVRKLAAVILQQYCAVINSRGLIDVGWLSRLPRSPRSCFHGYFPSMPLSNTQFSQKPRT